MQPDLLAQQFGGIERDTDTTPCVAGSVWKSTSRRIELRSYSFWAGSSGYRMDRGAMTVLQQNALRGLCVRSQPTGPVLSDIAAYQVDITDADGSVKSYRAAIDDMLDGDERDRSLPTIRYESLQPFLATFHCLHASESRAVRPHAGEAVDASAAPWTFAPTLPNDPGCLNGVFAPYGCGDAWIRVSVSARKRMTFTTENCVGVTQLKLLDQNGATELAQSPASSKPSCPSLSYSLAPGSYLLQLRKTNSGASCTAKGGAGDYWLRVSNQ